MNQYAVKLFTSVLPIFRYRICTTFGISIQYYEGVNKVCTGSGQGNKFAGDMCRNKSCLIIKKSEEVELGMIIEAPISNKKE